MSTFRKPNAYSRLSLYGPKPSALTAKLTFGKVVLDLCWQESEQHLLVGVDLWVAQADLVPVCGKILPISFDLLAHLL